MIKIIRTISNLIIIGEVIETEGKVTINKPFTVQPAQDGLQLFPTDAEIVGKEIESMEVPRSIVMYVAEPGDTIKDYYLSAVQGIQLEEGPQEILLG